MVVVVMEAALVLPGEVPRRRAVLHPPPASRLWRAALDVIGWWTPEATPRRRGCIEREARVVVASAAAGGSWSGRPAPAATRPG